MEASKIESRNVQGEDCCKTDVDEKLPEILIH